MRSKSWSPEPEPVAPPVDDPWELVARSFEVMSIPISEFYDDPVGFIEEFIDFGLPAKGTIAGLTEYQKAILRALVTKKRVAVRGPHGLGKALHVDTQIPTPSGWSRMGHLEIGDQVLDEQGKPCNVVSVSPRWQGDTWRVTFSDGSEIVTHGNHEWHAVHVSRRPKGVRDWRQHWAATDLVTTRDMAHQLRTTGGQLVWRVPTARPVQTPEADLPVDPYTLGVWLGDGITASGALTLNREDAPEILARTGGRVTSVEGPHAVRALVPGLHKALRLMGLLGHKHIPVEYLRASERQRRALLRGLMDTDGFRVRGGTDGIDLTCHELAADAKHLIEGLGMVVRLQIEEAAYTLNGVHHTVGLRWRMNFRADECPYTLARYVGAWSPREAQASRHTQRTVVSVEQIDDAETVCISVDSPSHLFLAGTQCIPTHNTTLNALAVLWFAITRDQAGVDWKVATTAGAWRQLEKYLWPEIKKWSRKLRWDKLGLQPWRDGQELMTLSLSLEHGEAFAAASSDPKKIEGVHADSVLYIFDESKAIAAATFDAAEGAFSGATSEVEEATEEEGRSLEALALATSTPGETVGRFYEIHQGKPGLEDWSTKHVTLKEVIRAGRVSEDWADARRRQWGEDSAIYANRVLGEFHSSAADVTIPLSWIEAANERWLEWKESGRKRHSHSDVYGVDVSRGDRDKTAIGQRCGDVVLKVTEYATADTTRINDLVKETLAERDVAVIDVVGIGGPVYDQLKKDGFNVKPFTASGKSFARDISGMLGFLNRRSEMWWKMREALNPDRYPKIALPPDPELIAELSAPKWSVTSGNNIQIEGKPELRKRLGRSTDKADAVLQTFVTPDSRDLRSADANTERPVAQSYVRAPDIHAFATGDGHTASDSGAVAFGSGSSDSFFSFGSDF